MRKRKEQPKLVVEIESDKKTGRIKTVSVFDNRTQKFWSEDQIQERGIVWFLDLADMKETLNWNTNGDSSKYQFKWGQSCRERSSGVAYIYQ